MNSGGNKIYKDGSLKNTMFLGTVIDVDDPDSYEGDVDLDLSGEDLYERRRAERDEAIREKEEERYGNLGYTEGEALISDGNSFFHISYSFICFCNSSNNSFRRFTNNCDSKLC